MDRIRVSRYNHFVHNGDGGVIGYNFLYRSILRIPDEAFPEIERILDVFSRESAKPEELSGSTPTQWIEALQEAHFLIDEEFDEFAFLKFQYYRNLYSDSSLTLVVLPTLWCNLTCPYCFEFKKPVFMSQEVENALIKWVENNFRHKRYIHVGWFGGEPLLAKETIFRLTARLQDICRQIGATFSSSLTTNGFYLDAEFQSVIPSLNIESVQVTLDGDKEEHDQLRRQRNGQGSFDRIFENIVSFSNRDDGHRLSLRVNCGDSNYKSIESLLERFPPEIRAQTRIYFRWIWANKACGYRDFAADKRGREPFKGLSALYEAARAKGWKTENPNNKSFSGYCEVDFLDQYDVDPEGNLYLCTHTFDNRESIGSLPQYDSMLHYNKIGLYTKWYAASPFDDSECMECKLLPACYGGCRLSRVKGHRQCIEERYSMDQFVKNLVLERLAQRNTEA